MSIKDFAAHLSNFYYTINTFAKTNDKGNKNLEDKDIKSQVHKGFPGSLIELSLCKCHII